MFVGAVGLLVVSVLLAGVGLEAARAVDAPLPERLRDPGPSLIQRLGEQAATRPGFVVGAVALAVVLLLYPFVDSVLRLADVAAPFRFWDFGA
jgi:hypothetical protein